MSVKKGRKCSFANCTSYQRTDENLSLFRFPKDAERCKAWIANIGRPELVDKENLNDDRVCEKHFELSMCLKGNDYRNHIQKTAIPTLCLDVEHPLIPSREPRSCDKLKMVGSYLMLDNSCKPPPFKRMKMDGKDDSQMIKLPVANERTRKYRLAPQKTYLDAYMEKVETGITYSKAAEKYNLNAITLQRFGYRYNKQMQPDATIHLIKKTEKKGSQTVLISPQISSQIHAQTSKPNQTSPATSMTVSVNNSAPSAGPKRLRKIFSVEQEEELAVFIRDTCNYYYEMTSAEVRTLAFVYGLCNQVDLPDEWRRSHQASIDWCLCFSKRNKLTPMMTNMYQFRSFGIVGDSAMKD